MSTYCTLQEIRDRGVEVDAASDDAVLAAIRRAERAVNAFAGRDFLKREATYRVDGEGTESVFLEDRPVIEILELQVAGSLLSPSSYILYPDAGYVRLLGSRDIYARMGGVFPRGSQNIEVHGFFGFERVPDEVNEAAVLLTMEILLTAPAEADVSAASGTRHAIGIRRVKVDDISVDFEYPGWLKSGSRKTLTTGLPQADALLGRFRQWLYPTVL